jgi:CheY-like chemotaxis protein
LSSSQPINLDGARLTMQEKLKVLVVDDEAVITAAARKMLGAEGFTVLTAGDAESALLLLPAESPRLAFLDLMLPGLSGMELLKRIRRDYPEVVVVMMTGYSTLDNAIAFLKNGAFDYLPKPFEFEELASTAQRASRFLAMGRPSIAPAAGTPPGRRCFLGVNAWACINPDGTAHLGSTDLFGRMTGRIESIELPVANNDIRQGSQLAQMLAADEMRHTVCAALSGRVIQVNPELAADCEVLNRDPMGDGWLVRLMPDNLETELANLTAG